MNKNELLFAKVKPEAIIPTKDVSNAGYDIYACFDEEYIMIPPHQTILIPTGLCSAFSEDFVMILKERGSTGTKGIAQRCGVVDSSYRGEIFAPITNTNNGYLIISKLNEKETIKKTRGYIMPHGNVIYPYSKAICQALMLPVPKMDVKEISLEELKSIPSTRGEGCLGSSGK